MKSNFKNENSKYFWEAFSGKISKDKSFYGNPHMARNYIQEERSLIKDNDRTL